MEWNCIKYCMEVHKYISYKHAHMCTYMYVELGGIMILSFIVILKCHNN